LSYIFNKMNSTNIITIVLVGIAALALVVFLIWKNQKDRKKLNPDAEDSVEETIMDQQRKKDSL
jgi:hypothetical protein